MSAIEETKTEIGVPKAAPRAGSASAITRVLDFLSSVRFGVSLLILLSVACMIGMLVMQQNVDGFDKYYLDLSPATRLLFGALGFFDIYHAWYFNALLLVLSLNIVLASIDRFPKAWTFVSRPKLDASAHWLRGQEQSATVTLAEDGARGTAAERVASAFSAHGLRPRVTEKGGRTFVFGERAVWNRLGAYAVHVALLTIFTGGFLTSQFGFTGNLSMEPGGSGNRIVERVLELDEPKLVTTPLPFTVECIDIQQKLIRKDGPITADNTLDWLTTVRIKDPVYGEREGVAHMNAPLDFKRGWWWDNYRFFQSSFTPNGKARSITLRVAPEAGGAAQDVTIARDGAGVLPDGTRIEFKDFSAKFSAGQQPQEQQEQVVYTNPAATLLVHPAAGGAPERAFAFTPQMAENAPIAKRAVAGYTFRLVDFEKVPEGHVLSVQRDPGATVVYVGFILLGLTLCAVFFFSHQRVWALIEERGQGRCEVVLGGNTNRNKLGFEDRFKRIAAALGGQNVEVK